MFRLIGFRTFCYFLPAVLMMAALSGFALAQSDSPQVAKLTVELWPEFDRPEVLVIYRAELSESTPLPAEVTFRFPGYVEAMHAVAVEQSGGLYSVEKDLIIQNRSDDALELTFPVESRAIHMEYYDPEILTRQGQNRAIDYRFSSDYAAETALFQIQEPLESADFSLSPPASTSFTDKNRQKYQIIEMAGLKSGDVVEINATYSRSTDTPSRELISAPKAAASDVQVVTETAAGGQDFSLGYMLIGVGVLLLAATGGYWWWQKRTPAAVKTASRRQPAVQPVRKKRAAPRKKSRGATPPVAKSSAGYCFQCGSAQREDARFCHVCGTDQRDS